MSDAFWKVGEAFTSPISLLRFICYVVVLPVLFAEMYRLPILMPVEFDERYVVLVPMRTEFGRIIAVLFALSLPNVAEADTVKEPETRKPVELAVMILAVVLEA
jgi:hypothetical protein